MTAVILERVASMLGERAATASDTRVTVGDNLVVVDTTHPEHGRLAGVAHRPDGSVDDIGVTVGSVPASRLLGLATGSESYLGRAVGLAAANALSAPDIGWEVGDPMAALPADIDTVATVGLFGPAFRKFHAVEVRVVERDPPDSVDAPGSVNVALFGPEECAAAFTGADICFLTGSVFIYGGVDRYLSALAEAGVTPVVLVGATASHLPEPAFEAGVDVVAGARVTAPRSVRERVAAGECATDLHGHGLEKVYVAAGDPDGLIL